MDLIEGIKLRSSIRNFVKGYVIPEEDIKTMLECAMHAPSALNIRPWKFIVVSNQKVKEELALAHSRANACIDASIVIVVVALNELQENRCSTFYPQDCAAATENILLSATALNYGSLWCGVYPNVERQENIKKVLNLSEGIVFNLICIGKTAISKKTNGLYEEQKVSYIK